MENSEQENMYHKNLLFSYCADPSDPTGPLVGAKVKYFFDYFIGSKICLDDDDTLSLLHGDFFTIVNPLFRLCCKILLVTLILQFFLGGDNTLDRS